MAMNVGSADGADEDRVVSEINTTPLVDVMLVLLIIFLITIPVVTTSIKVNLPKESNQIRETKPENIIISVDAAGRIYWYDTRMANATALVEKLKKVSTMNPQPEVQIRGDLSSNYEPVGRVLYAVQRAGIAKVSFITEPQGPGGGQ
jgi:biopolymer transport protein ExbD